MAESRHPFVYTFPAVLFAIVLVVAILYVGQAIFLPIIFSGFIAILLNPVVNWLHRHRIPRLAAIILALLVSLLVVAGIITFFAWQVSDFTEEVPRLEQKLDTYLADVQTFVEETFGIKQSKQAQLLRQGTQSMLQNSGVVVGGLFMALGGLSVILVLVPLYVFLFLYYRDLIVEFFFRLAAREDQGTVRVILSETGGIVQQYLVGLMVETAIIAVLNIIALLALGIEYAVLFGVLAAVLNLIPYIGIFIGSLFPMIMALITKDSILPAVGVVGLFTLIQFLDNNVIVPLVVGGRIRINSIVAIAGVIAGGLIWGIPGMFLSLPLAAILKVIFDRIEPLKPWGLLLGDTVPGRKTRLVEPKAKKEKEPAGRR